MTIYNKKSFTYLLPNIALRNQGGFNVNILRKFILFFLYFLIFQHASKAASEIAIPYREHPWSETLSAQEQRAAIVMYQIALASKVESVMTASKNDVDRMWGLKILGCGHSLAAQVSTKNKDQREALVTITMAFDNAITGKGTPANRVKALREAEIIGQKIADSIPNRVANDLQERYSAELKRFHTDLIVAAMLCASEKSPARQKS